MRILTYQQKGCMAEKKEMEDRLAAGNNVLSSGFHYMETDDGGIYAVFDGVGGLAGSAFASTTAARAMTDIDAPYDPDLVRETLREVHKDLVEYSKTATTATGISIFGDTVHLFHIGNCRLYGLFDGYIRQITVDQTLYEDLLNAGQTIDEIPESAKCKINACLGVKQEFINQLVFENISSQYSQCQKLLMTSDGVHDHLDIEALESMLKDDVSRESLQKLAELAVENGSEDDISIMAVEK